MAQSYDYLPEHGALSGESFEQQSEMFFRSLATLVEDALTAFDTASTSAGDALVMAKEALEASTNAQALAQRAMDAASTDMMGATALTMGAAGRVPAPSAGKEDYFLRGDATWAIPIDTTYIAGTGLQLNVVSGENVFALTNTGVNAATYGADYNRQLSFGETFPTVGVSVDAQGRITHAEEHQITLPLLDMGAVSNGVLAVQYGGTGASTVANIMAGKDIAGNSIIETYATKEDIAQLANGLIQTVNALPDEGVEGVIYMVPDPDNPNNYEKYTWDNGTWVSLGSTTIDLSGYATKSEAVSNITASGTTLVVSKADGTYQNVVTQDTTYSAGTGLALTGTTFSLASTTVTPGRYGLDNDSAPEVGGTVSIPYLTIDAYGRITVAETHTLTLPTYTQGTGIAISSGSIALAASGVTAGTYGPAANETLDFGDSVTIPSLKVDTYGRIIVANARTITLPADSNTDTTVVQSASTSNANYPVLLCPTANASTNQGAKQAIFSSKIKVNPSTGAITATSFIGNISGSSDTADTLTTARLIDGVSFNGGSNIVHYGTCSTAAATAEKVVSVTGFTLATGAEVCVKFTVTNTASPVTLNVNSTGAKQIQYRGTAIAAGNIAANRVYRFVYDGNFYQLEGDIDTNTNNATAQNISTANNTYPILLGNTANATANIGNKATLFGSGIKANPSTSTITASAYSGAGTGTTYVSAVTSGKALLNATHTGYGGIWNASVKEYKVGVSTYPSSDNKIYWVSVTNANVTAGTNTTNKTMTWDAGTGILTATGFSGPLTGNVTGNCSGSSGSCTGNAATATQFSANKSVTLTGDVTGTASSKAGWSVATTLANSGVTAGNYGPSANASPAHSGTFSVPYITVDAKGRVTAASTKTITLPASGNTDAKVAQNVSTANNTYPLLGAATANATANISATSTYFSSKCLINYSTGCIYSPNMFGTVVAMSANDIALGSGCVFTKTISANTTLTISGTPSGRAATFSLALTNGGSKTITWPSSVKWASGEVPSLTASGVDIITFITVNGGTTWYGTPSVLDAK